MGYRHTLVGQYYGGKFPKWFVDKYSKQYFLYDLLVSSKMELKYYSNGFFEDLQKALIESRFFDDRATIGTYELVVLSDDGFVNKVVIKKDEIKYYHFGDESEATHTDHIDYYYS